MKSKVSSVAITESGILNQFGCVEILWMEFEMLKIMYAREKLSQL
jgi:hypothetical protein